MKNLSLFIEENVLSFVPANHFTQHTITKNKILVESDYILEHYKTIFGILQRKQLLNACTSSYAIHNLSNEDLTTILLEVFSGEVVSISDIYQILIEVIYPMYRPQIRKVIKNMIKKKLIKEILDNSNEMIKFISIDTNNSNLSKYF